MPRLSPLAVDRSSGEAEDAHALIAAGKVLALLTLEKFARAKTAKDQDGFEVAEKPLAEYYIQNQGATLPARGRVPALQADALREASLYLIE